MQINADLISYLEDLSYLTLTDDEKQRLTVELEDILSYIARLGELDTENITERSHPGCMGEQQTRFSAFATSPFNHVNAFRNDEVLGSFDRALILQNAPRKNEKAFIAPKTVK